MRWEQLFADLEAQLDAAEREEWSAEISDRTRREVALIALADRFRAAEGCQLVLSVAGAGNLAGMLRRVGAGWVLLEPTGAVGAVVVNTEAVVAIRGLPSLPTGAGTDGGGRVGARLDLNFVLRGIARDRASVALVLRDGTRLAGTIDRVGADFIDLAEHPADEARRTENVTGSRVVATAALAVVRAG